MHDKNGSNRRWKGSVISGHAALQQFAAWHSVPPGLSLFAVNRPSVCWYNPRYLRRRRAQAGSRVAARYYRLQNTAHYSTLCTLHSALCTLHSVPLYRVLPSASTILLSQCGRIILPDQRGIKCKGSIKHSASIDHVNSTPATPVSGG